MKTVLIGTKTNLNKAKTILRNKNGSEKQERFLIKQKPVLRSKNGSEKQKTVLSSKESILIV